MENTESKEEIYNQAKSQHTLLERRLRMLLKKPYLTAEEEIEKAALEDGILTQANQNAENYMYRLLRDLGYPEVIFVKAEPTPTP